MSDKDKALKLLRDKVTEDLETKITKLNCDHGVVFDEEEYRKHENMSPAEVQKRWPRGFGPCPKGCGFDGIAYASYMHYLAGDW